MPGRPQRPGQQAICLVIIDEFFSGWVPFELAIQPNRNFCNQAKIRGFVAGFNIRYRVPATADALQEIAVVTGGFVEVNFIWLEFNIQ